MVLEFVKIYCSPRNKTVLSYFLFLLFFVFVFVFGVLEYFVVLHLPPLPSPPINSLGCIYQRKPDKCVSKMASSAAKEVIAITGVSSGLGLAMVNWFQSKGYLVVGCSRSTERINELNKKFCARSKTQFYAVDIVNDAQVKDWVDKVVASFGSPSFLLNNAGTINNRASLWNVPVEEFDQVIDVNIKGTNNVLRHFIPHMIKAKKGVIANFTSGWGRHTAPNVAPYCAAKYALEGLSKALAMELPAPLTCVPINPGIINTPLLRIAFGPRADGFPDPDEWAESACPYILSLNRTHNGQSVETP